MPKTPFQRPDPFAPIYSPDVELYLDEKMKRNRRLEIAATIVGPIHAQSQKWCDDRKDEPWPFCHSAKTAIQLAQALIDANEEIAV